MDAGKGTTVPHILILEDDTAHMDLVLQAFREDPHQVRVSVAGTIHDAGDIIGRDPPDLIIADWMLTDGNGIEILPRRDGVVTVPLVIMTGYGDERLAVEIMKSGAIDYVVKSATVFRDLPHIARRALRDWDNMQKRKRAEEADRNSQKRLADILSFLPDAVLAIDNKGRVIAWNKAIEEMTGVAAVDMLGKGDHEYSLPFYGERHPILIDQVLMEDTEIGKKYPFVRRYGEKIVSEAFIPSMYGGRGAHLCGTASPLYDTSGNRVGAIETIRDITDRKRNEEQLLRREASLETLLNAPIDTLLLLDRQGTIIRINEEGARQLRAAVPDVIGRCVYDLLPQDVAKSRRENIERVFEFGEPARFEETRSGQYLHNEVFPLFNKEHTVVEHVAIFSTDITEQKKAEEKLRESGERYRALLFGAGIGVEYWTAEGTLQFLNVISLKHLKGKEEDFIGKNMHEIFGDASGDRYLERIHRAAASPDPIEYEDDVSLPAGKRWYLKIYTRITGPDGTVRGIQVLSIDITGRKQAEEIRKAYEARLDSAMDIGNLAWWEMDLQDGAVRFNDRKAKILGYSPEQFHHYSDFTTLLHPDDYEPAMHAMKDHLEGRVSQYHIDYRIRTAAGDYRWFRDVGGITRRHPDGLPETVTGFVIDITVSKQAEKALQESEQKFRSLVGYAFEGILILDFQGKILFTNNSAARMIEIEGHTGLIGRNVLEFLAPESQEDIFQNFLQINQGHDPYLAHYNMISVKGKKISLECIGKVVTYEGNQSYLISIRDITEQKKSEDALKESSKKYAELFELGSEAIFLIDNDSGALLEANAAASEMYGYSRDSLLTMKNTDLSAEKEATLKTTSETPQGSIQVPLRYHRRNDGTVFPVEILGRFFTWNGRSVHIAAIRDITERKKVEEVLRDSEMRYRSVIENSADGIVVVQDGIVQFANTRALEMIDSSPEEIGNQPFIGYIHPEDRELVSDRYQRRILGEDVPQHYDFRIFRKSGQIIWVQISAVQISWKNRPATLNFLTNINDRKLMESEIRSLNTVLEQRIKERTEALTKVNKALEEENTQRQEAEKKLQGSYDEKVMLLKEIHHRVKNNLQIIVSLLNLQSRTIKDESTRSAIRDSQNRVKAMAIVHEKLYQAEDIAHISLEDYIRFLGTGLFQFYDAKSRSIRFTLEIHEVYVDIDVAIPLGLILNELISNSLKYAFPDGRKGEIAISVKREDHTMTILFRDTGIGIPADLDWRNTQSLGLRLVNTLVEQMNGTVELDRSAGTLLTMIVHEKEPRGP